MSSQSLRESFGGSFDKIWTIGAENRKKIFNDSQEIH